MIEENEIIENSESLEETVEENVPETTVEEIEKTSSKADFYTKPDYNKIQENHSKPPIVVVGAGSIGGLTANLLMRQNERVVCISSVMGSKRISAEGLSLNSKVYGDYSCRPETSAWIKEKPELVIIATKANHLPVAMTAVHPERVKGTIILPLTSGCEHIKILRNDYGASVAVARIQPILIRREDSNLIVHEDRKLKILMANNRPSEKEKLEKIAVKLKNAGIVAEVVENEQSVIWSGMVTNCAISLVTASAKMNLSEVLEDDYWASRLEIVAKEALNVAKIEGWKSSMEEIMRFIKAFPQNYEPPLLKDVEKGRIGEIDAIARSVVRYGARHEIKCPIITSLINNIVENADEYYQV